MLLSNNHILMVFEGEKTEKAIFSSLNKYYLNEDGHEITIAVYCNNIYSLYHEIKDDPYLDIFMLLKENENNMEVLSELERDDISQIYFFFDYDGHDTQASDSDLKELLKLFKEETEHGKLYLSYPMVESIKHLNDNVSFQDVTVCAQEKRYKELVDKEAGNSYKQIKKYSEDDWKEIIIIHLKKLGYILTDNFEILETTNSQLIIFEKQQEKYINKNNTIAVLSAFPIFISEYSDI